MPLMCYEHVKEYIKFMSADIHSYVVSVWNTNHDKIIPTIIYKW